MQKIKYFALHSSLTSIHFNSALHCVMITNTKKANQKQKKNQKQSATAMEFAVLMVATAAVCLLNVYKHPANVKQDQKYDIYCILKQNFIVSKTWNNKIKFCCTHNRTIKISLLTIAYVKITCYNFQDCFIFSIYCSCIKHSR